MNTNRFNRRQFIQRTAALAGTAVLAPTLLPAVAATGKRTAVDQVTLGKTGLKLSRLGFGTGTNGGKVQFELGREGFIKLVHYAYDQGITYFDCAGMYRPFAWMGDALKGLPRERLFLQSKIMGKPENVLATIDEHRKNFNTDYLDSLLLHCMTTDGWTDEYKRLMDAYDEAKEKKWIRAKGVSCHSVPALRAAVASDWNEVHLVRVNPQGRHVDGQTGKWGDTNTDLPSVLKEIKAMRAKNRGVIGMKILGNGDFTDPADREKSIRFAMAQPEIDAVVMGFKSTAEIDEAIARINRALAAA